DLAALERLEQPVYAALERDPVTKRLIERIRQLKLETRLPPPVPPCHKTTPSPPPPAGAKLANPIPDGVYRLEFTVKELVDAGLDKPTAHENSGVLTLGVAHGRYRLGQKTATHAISPTCSGSITYAGARVTFVQGCMEFTGSWRLKGGELRFK